MLKLPSQLNVVADAAIPGLAHYFSQRLRQAFLNIGIEDVHIQTYQAQDIRAEHLTKAHVLLVRSTLEINQQLLNQAPDLLFVGSCTSGIDHLDTQALEQRGIYWAHALGCNANAVAEYVLLQTMRYCHLTQKSLKGLSTAIIGYGCVGQQVAHKLSLFGCDVRVVDPLRFTGADQTVVLTKPIPEIVAPSSTPSVVDLPTAMASEIVTLHVPLTRSGPHPTHHLLGPEQLQLMPQQSLLINAARGAVFNLKESLAWRAQLTQAQRAHRYWVFDVFEGEPTIALSSLQALLGATPHIAGHSQIGKEQGTRQVWQALLGWLGLASFALDYPMQASGLVDQYQGFDQEEISIKQWLDFLEHTLGLIKTEQVFFARFEALAAQAGGNNVDDRLCAKAFGELRRAYTPRLELAQQGVDASFLGEADRLRLASLGLKLG